MNNSIKSRKPKLKPNKQNKKYSKWLLVALQNLNRKVSNVISNKFWGNPDVQPTLS